MQKIMFNDRYGLTQAVLNGHKTMTRRAVSACIHKKAGLYRQEYFDGTLDALSVEDSLLEFSPLKVGEVVAVAQSYKDIYHLLPEDLGPLRVSNGYLHESPGATNKMFVLAHVMPHQIRITSVRVERLQDISDEDCIKEGVQREGHGYYVRGKSDIIGLSAKSVFEILIDKVSGNGTWASNPYVYVYEFELVK